MGRRKYYRYTLVFVWGRPTLTLDHPEPPRHIADRLSMDMNAGTYSQFLQVIDHQQFHWYGDNNTQLSNVYEVNHDDDVESNQAAG